MECAKREQRYAPESSRRGMLRWTRGEGGGATFDFVAIKLTSIS